MDARRSSSGASEPVSPPLSPGPGSPGTPVDHETMIGLVKSVIPPLTADRHKGELGRIGVIGGCETYTGAPYYAAMSALKVGCDLSHVFCTAGAAPVIKSYSPELIVHPLLDGPNAVDEVAKWLPRLHALVVGPGLGREEQLLTTVKGILHRAKRMQIPFVIDADGLYLVTQDPSVIKGYTRAILTPNVMEFGRLYQTMLNQKQDSLDDVSATSQLSKSLDNVTVVRKGPVDVICTGDKMVVCSVEGSNRRCGGQGDLLSGSMGTFLHWAQAGSKTTDSYLLKTKGPNLVGAYAACALTRVCNRRAYARLRRATLTTDMLEEVPAAFQSLFEPSDD